MMNSYVLITQLRQLSNHGQYCVIYIAIHYFPCHTSIILNQISAVIFCIYKYFKMNLKDKDS